MLCLSRSERSNKVVSFFWATLYDLLLLLLLLMNGDVYRMSHVRWCWRHYTRTRTLRGWKVRVANTQTSRRCWTGLMMTVMITQTPSRSRHHPTASPRQPPTVSIAMQQPAANHGQTMQTELRLPLLMKTAHPLALLSVSKAASVNVNWVSK